MKKYHTGDLFLGNKWTLDSMFSHAMNSNAKWSEVGIFDVEDRPGEDPTVSVFILTDNGAQKVTLHDVLSDPTLQSSAYRPFISGQKALLAANIKEGMRNLVGSSRENVLILLDELKGNTPERSGFTPAELVLNVLSTTKLVMYHDGVKASVFQEGGALDKYYGEELPLIPIASPLTSAINSDNNLSDYQNSVVPHMTHSDVVLAAAIGESNKLVSDYLAATPRMTFNNYKYHVNTFSPSNNNNSNDESERQVSGFNPKQAPAEAKYTKTEPVHPGYDSYPSEMPRIMKKRYNTSKVAEADTSAILTKKLTDLKKAQAQYVRPSPNGKPTPPNTTEI